MATLGEQMRTLVALLLGRKMCESFRGYWPVQTSDTTGISAYLNRESKYVLSTTTLDRWSMASLRRGCT